LRAVEQGKVVDAETLARNGWEQGKPVDLSIEEEYQKAVRVAEELVQDVHMEYTRFNKPQVVRRSGMLRSMYTFRGYAQHLTQAYMHFLKNAGPRGKQAAVASMAMQVAFGGATANWLLGAALDAFKWWEKESLESKAREALPEYSMAWDALFMGMPSLAGVHLGGSFETGFPTTVAEAVGIPAAIVKDISDGYEAWASGNPKKAMEYVAPLVVMRNALKAYRESQYGQRTVGGRPLNVPGEAGPYEPTLGETLLQAAGFRPTGTEKRWRASQEIQDILQYKKKAQEKLMDRYGNAVAEERWDDAVGVLDEVQAWNMLWASRGREELLISKDSLNGAIKARTLPRKEPKQMRGKAAAVGEAFGR
jgi:hypothetical protein